MKTKIGARVIKTELLTGVDNSNPLKKASMFITIPRKEHKTSLGQSFFSIDFPLKNKLKVQNNNEAPNTLKKIKPKGSM